jgi:hypothetical protein
MYKLVNLLSLKQIHNIEISSSPHRTLNSGRGINHYRDDDLSFGALRIVVTIDVLVVFLSTLEAFYFPFGLTFIISKFLTQRAGFGTYGLSLTL